jgi:hypothetical protein
MRYSPVPLRGFFQGDASTDRRFLSHGRIDSACSAVIWHVH